MKDINIYIVRHGEASISWGGPSDPGLSPEGKSQAKKVASKLAKLNSDRLQIISSPRKRAIETAESLGNILKKPIKIKLEFNEIPSHKAKQKSLWLKRVAITPPLRLPNYLILWQKEILQNLLTLEQDTIIFSHFMVMNAIYAKLHKTRQLVSIQPAYTSQMHLIKKNNDLIFISLSNENTSKIIV
ncbi:MAG: histidine phosphatase family protein [Gammaproteobacteria bacterium]